MWQNSTLNIKLYKLWYVSAVYMILTAHLQVIAQYQNIELNCTRTALKIQKFIIQSTADQFSI